MSGNRVLEFAIKVKDLTQNALQAAQARIRSFASRATSHFKSFASGAVSAAKSVGAQLMNIKAGLDMAAAAVRTFAGIFATAIGEAFRFEKATSDFRVLLGSIDKAKEHLAELRDFAARTPLTFNDLSSASKLLLSFGTSVEEIMPALKTLGDISMGDAQRFQGLALVFGQCRAAGRLMGQDLLQMINQGFNPLTIIAKETGKSMVELKEMMSDGAISFEMVRAAMESATGAGGLFDNAMESASTTGAGLISSLQDNWTEAVRTFGEAFSGSAKDGIQMLLDKLTELIENGDIQVWADRAAKALGKVAGFAKDLCSSVGAIAKFAWNQMGISDVVHGIEGTVKGAAAAAGTLFGGGSWSEAMEANDYETTKAFAKGHYLGKMVRDGTIQSKGGDRALSEILKEEEETAKREAEIRKKAQEEAEERRRKKEADKDNVPKSKSVTELMAEAEARVAEKKAAKEAEAAKKAAAKKAEEEKKLREKEEAERRKIEEKIHQQRLRYLSDELSQRQKEQSDAESALAAAEAKTAQAWGWYRDKDSLAAQIAEEKADAEARKQFEKDFERLRSRRSDWRTADDLSLDDEAVRRVGLAREEENAAREYAKQTAEATQSAAESLEAMRSMMEGAD